MRDTNLILHSLSAATLLLCSINVQSEELENYCLDEQLNNEWKALETMSGTRPDIVELSKYRTRVYTQLENGDISLVEGIAMFEDRREFVMSRVKGERF